MGSYHLTILKIVDETDDVRSFFVEKPSSFIFSPGQYCMIGSRVFPHEYSPMAIASGIREDFLLFTVRRWGEVSNRLFELNVGDILVVDGPKGTSLPLSDLRGSRILCVAKGTGLTPIRSLVNSLDEGMVSVLYGVRDETSILYRDEFSKWGGKLITKDAGSVTDLIGDKVDDFAFVVGSTPMIRATVEKLMDNGWNPEDIFVSVEKFVGGEVFGPVFRVSELIKLKEYLGQVIP